MNADPLLTPADIHAMESAGLNPKSPDDRQRFRDKHNGTGPDLDQFDAYLPPAPEKLKFTVAEIQSARLAPTCIVKNYLYADVATMAAPGGTGKTTLNIYEMVCIALGRPVFGLQVEKSGWSLFVTAEDRREIIAARLREVMRALDLSPFDRAKVIDRVRAWDTTGQPVRLAAVVDGNVVLTSLADDIIDAYRADPPVFMAFDPAVSFGASETLINDNEQALVVAARRIIRALDCCVRFIAHTGKSNARDKTLDQYSSRGGSALSDGARMVAVLQPWAEEESASRRPPAGCTPTPEAGITILARPKLSYAPPNLPLIWIRRIGFEFQYFAETQVSRDDHRRALADQLERFIESELKFGRKHTKATIETSLDSMTRAEIRAALNMLFVQGRIVEMDLPKADRQGGRKTYLAPNLAGISVPGGEVPNQ